MARKINRLGDRKVAALKKPGMYPDGLNLYLQIDRGGAKSWIFRYPNKKEPNKRRDRYMGLGPVHTVSLADARLEAEKCRKLRRQGMDPIDHREQAQLANQIDSAKSMTFGECAERYISAHSATWKNIKHTSQWANTLTTYAYPVFGDLPVQTVDVGLVMKVLEPIWTVKTETASRVRCRIESVLDWANARNYREGENPARWKGHLDKLLPSPAKLRGVKHHAALPYVEISNFLKALRGQDGISAKGLEFMILTAARTGEVIKAEWAEIDFKNKVWTVPAGRMKNKKEHRVPLSLGAMAVLNGMNEIAQNKFVFPGMRANSHLSNMAFLQLLKRMDRADLTGHGFRSTFRDWVSERTGFPREVAEMALAHTISDAVEAAYRRGDLFDKRRKLMDVWSEYCALEPAEIDDVETVVPLRQA